jgi:hypothetical protein
VDEEEPTAGARAEGEGCGEVAPKAEGAPGGLAKGLSRDTGREPGVSMSASLESGLEILTPNGFSVVVLGLPKMPVPAGTEPNAGADGFPNAGWPKFEDPG